MLRQEPAEPSRRVRIAKALIDRGEVDRIIVIAPRAEVVNQWAEDFRRVTGRFMTKVTGREPQDVGTLGMDLCATWSAVQGLLDALQAVCRSTRVLVICDEHHHAAVEAAWGKGTNSAFAEAAFALVLTGTPIRTDGARSVRLAYDDAGTIDHPEAGTFTLTYGEAVDLGYCRPLRFTATTASLLSISKMEMRSMCQGMSQRRFLPS